jgi:hypothetical protein
MALSLGLGLGLTPARGGPPPLLDDSFAGTEAALAGRIPPIGPTWGVTGADAADVVAGDGQMYDKVSSEQFYYATADLSQMPREIGCRFLNTDPYMAYSLGGTPSSGRLLAIQIVPSGVADASFTQVNYTTTAGDTTLAITAASFAAAINANATMIANGITATAVGSDIQLRATRSPHIRTVFATSPLTASIKDSANLTLASWPTGGNFLDQMIHFRSTSSGRLVWTVFNNAELPLSSVTVTHLQGLLANTEYVYRCQIDGNTLTGGIFDLSGNAVCTVVGSDSRVSTWSGNSAFWEAGGSRLRFRRAWATSRINQLS